MASANILARHGQQQCQIASERDPVIATKNNPLMA